MTIEKVYRISALLIILCCLTLTIGPARADYLIKDGLSVNHSVHAFSCGSDANGPIICPGYVPMDVSGNTFGVTANPFFISFAAGATLPAFASTPTFNCGTGCSSTGGTFNNNADGIATSSTNGQAAAWGYFWNGTTWDRTRGDTTNGAWVNVKTSVLPTGAATQATLASILANLGSPFQAGASIGNTSFGSTLAAETTKVIGTVRNVGNAGAIFDGATGAAVPANALYWGINIAGNLVGPTGLALGATTKAQSVAIVDASGNQITAFGGSGGTASNFGSVFPTPGTAAGFSDGTNMVAGRVIAAGADAVSNSTPSLISGSFGYFYNGTTWDRTRGDTTNGTWVNVKTSVLPTGAAISATQGTVTDAPAAVPATTTSASEVALLKALINVANSPGGIDVSSGKGAPSSAPISLVPLSTPVNSAFSTATTGGTLANTATYYYRVSALNATGETLASAETSQPVSGPLSTPVNSAFSTATTGGTLAAGTYFYRVSALNAIGGTLASTETSQVTTGATSTVTVNWGAVSGATGYKVYGRTTGAELLIATVGAVTTFIDTGSVTPSGALPGSNTTATSTNTVTVNWATVTGATGYKVYGRTTGAELLITTLGVVLTYTDTGSVTPSGALPASDTTAASAQIVPISGGTAIYVTSFDFAMAGTSNVSLVYGTGTNCGTGQTALTGLYPATAQFGVAKGSGIAAILKVPSGNALCAISSAGNVAGGGSVSFQQF